MNETIKNILLKHKGKNNAITSKEISSVRPCGHNPGQGTVRSVLICVCILLGSSREETA